MAKTAFATVGTTQFTALIETLLSDEVLQALVSQGFERLVLQVGKGPEPTVPKSPPLAIEWYQFKPSLEEDMRSAALVVSHAGAGSILEGLRLRAQMVVVVNDALMDNHQQELAHELHSRWHLLATTPSGLLATLRSLVEAPPNLAPFPPADQSLFPGFLATTLGIEGEQAAFSLFRAAEARSASGK